MKSKIIILNSCSYMKNDKQLTKIEFVIADKQENKNYKGLTPMKCYYVGRVNHDKITLDMIGIPLECLFEERINYNDPLSTKKILKEFIYKDNVINLL